jgi:hypothetical protein
MVLTVKCNLCDVHSQFAYVVCIAWRIGCGHRIDCILQLYIYLCIVDVYKEDNRKLLLRERFSRP